MDPQTSPGAAEGQPTGQPAGPPAPPTPASMPPQQGAQPPATGQPEGQGQPQQGDVSSLPEWAQQIIRSARDEAAGRRVELRQQQTESDERDATLKKVAAALGIDAGDGQPDPVKLTEQLESAKAAERKRAVELAVYRAAGKAGADPDVLLDSRGFMTEVDDLDPSAKDFGDRIAEAITNAVKANPRYAAAGQAPPAPPRSGGDFNGSPGGTAITEEQLKGMSAEEIAEALEAGKLQHLL